MYYRTYRHAYIKRLTCEQRDIHTTHTHTRTHTHTNTHTHTHTHTHHTHTHTHTHTRTHTHTCIYQGLVAQKWVRKKTTSTLQMIERSELVIAIGMFNSNMYCILACLIVSTCNELTVGVHLCQPLYCYDDKPVYSLSFPNLYHGSGHGS